MPSGKATSFWETQHEKPPPPIPQEAQAGRHAARGGVMGYPAKTERNAAMLADYNAGEWVPDIAAKYGIHPTNAYRILRRDGAFGDVEKVAGRIRLRNQAIARTERVSQAKREAMLMRWRSGMMRHKPKLFADDPAKRDDYLALRNTYGAAYAREAMGVL